MLSYHPASDPYHAALRMLQLCAYDEDRSFYKHNLKILSFYLLFPEFIKKIVVTQPLAYKKKTVSPSENKYFTPSDKKNVFTQMNEIQDVAISLLINLDVIRKEEGKYRLSESRESALVEMAKEKNEQQDAVVSFLMDLSNQVPELGEKSLKDRTNLMEYRYDYV